jgi:hypothetical protein
LCLDLIFKGLVSKGRAGAWECDQLGDCETARLWETLGDLGEYCRRVDGLTMSLGLGGGMSTEGRDGMDWKERDGAGRGLLSSEILPTLPACQLARVGFVILTRSF